MSKPQTLNESPVQLLEYLVNLSEDAMCAPFIMMDEYVFSTYLTAILQGVPQDDGNTALRRILREVLPNFDFDDFQTMEAISYLDKQEKLGQIVNNLRAQFSDSITTTYVRDFVLSAEIYHELLQTYKNNFDAGEALKKLVNLMFDEMIKKYAGKTTSITINIQRLTDALDLTVAEGKLIELALLYSTDIRAAIFRDFLFTITKNPTLYEHFYSVMLGSNEDHAAVVQALSERSKPIALGIVNFDNKSKRLGNLSEFWVYTVTAYTDTVEKFYERFIEELKEPKKTFSGSLAKASTADEVLLQGFLDKAYVASTRAKHSTDEEVIEKSLGLNVMFYGSRRLDKMGYIYNLLKDGMFKVMKIRTKDAKGGDIPAICYLAQQRAKALTNEGKQPVLLVVEKADSALTRSMSRAFWFLDMFGDNEEKGDEMSSDEMLLIKNPVPSIWLVDSPASITTENVGKFLLHVEMKGGSRADRREEVQKVVGELGLTPELAMKLSKYVEINVEQIKSAARTIQLLDHHGEVGETSLLQVVHNGQRALEREKMEELRDSVTKYSLDLLNIAGNLPLDKIIHALKRRPVGSMCFYGPPGTGKTQLAEYMAMELDMPLIAKRASDLLDKYLGESEKRIAEMFEEARAEGAILLLDEADSFLRDRAMATKSWEVTQVNELLQRMERFQGIFICATNLFSSLDAAALRRFAFKLEFKALTSEQRLKMLENEANISIDSLDAVAAEHVKSTLFGISHLTPGDFATVRRQANLLGEDLEVEIWLERLQLESKAKLLGLERNGMGFIGGGEVAERSHE